MKKFIITFLLFCSFLMIGCTSTDKTITSLQFDFEEMELLVGQELILPLSFEGSGTIDDIEITVDNPEVVQIDGDQMKIKSVGAAYITAVAKKNRDLSSTLRIIVKGNEKAKLVRIDMPTNAIRIGSSLQITITNFEELGASSNLDFIWESSDEKIASFDQNYLLKGNQQGEVDITITQKNAPQNFVKRHIKVGYASDEKKNNEPNSGSLILYTENDQYTIEAGVETQLHVLGASNLQRYFWTSSDEEVLCVTETGILIGCRPGKATVSVVSKDADPGTNNHIDIVVTGESKLNYIERILQAALSQEGEKELTGNNDSKFNEWAHCYEAWCAVFVSWSANEAGIPKNIVYRSISVSTFMSWYEQRDLFFKKEDYKPVAGDLIIFKNAGASHIGIVVTCDDTTVYTIEGNTSNMVARRQYSLDYETITGYAHPNYGQYSYDTGVKWEKYEK